MKFRSLDGRDQLLLRTLAAACCVLAHGRTLRATEGILHGPMIAQVWAICSFLGTMLISFLSRGNLVGVLLFIAPLFAFSAVFSTAASLPLVATVAAAITASAQAAAHSTYLQLLAAALFVAVLIFPVNFTVSNDIVRVLQAIALGATASDFVGRFSTGDEKREHDGGKRRRKPVRQKSMFARRWLVLFSVSVLGWSFVPQAGVTIMRSIYPRNMPTGYILRAQERGSTGRISVIEESRNGVRLLTSDHSILGGAYIARGYESETVFSQFHVHEAVRLTRRPGEDENEPAGGREGRALCLGLGIGVVAQALNDLGSDVTAVEIDPVVARYAKRYFGVRGPAVHVMDAIEYLRRAREQLRKTQIKPFEYVVHDVFTGGAVPLAMFNVDTFRMIHDVMTDDGVLALNFVGALDEPDEATTRAVAALRARLETAFRYVSAFAEDEESKVQNVVFFASDAEERMWFRKPIRRDFLDSTIRQDALKSFEKRRITKDRVPRIRIEEATDKQINAGQWITASEHWKSMRKILDRSVWYALASAENCEK